MDTAQKTKIRQDLINQLERKGVYGAQYIDLVDDYISLWEIKNSLLADIEERGVVVEWQNGPQRGLKKNESIGELKKVNDAMLKILKALELQPSSQELDDNEEM